MNDEIANLLYEAGLQEHFPFFGDRWAFAVSVMIAAYAGYRLALQRNALTVEGG